METTQLTLEEVIDRHVNLLSDVVCIEIVKMENLHDVYLINTIDKMSKVKENGEWYIYPSQFIGYCNGSGYVYKNLTFVCLDGESKHIDDVLKSTPLGGDKYKIITDERPLHA